MGESFVCVNLPDRIASKIEVDEDGCWLWTAALDRCGYAKVGWHGQVLGAHRVVYELLVGPIPEGLTIDHLCRVRSCVNPAHMEPVTQRENTLRGETLAAANVAKTHCKLGHPFDDQNTYVNPKGHRYCLTCKRRWAFRVGVAASGGGPVSLRTGAIEAAAQGIGLVTGEPWELYQVEADAALDALLDYLEAHADEWDTRAFELQEVEGPLWQGPTPLIAALRGDS